MACRSHCGGGYSASREGASPWDGESSLRLLRGTANGRTNGPTSPADVLGALREHFVSGGPFGVTQDTEGVLEVEDRSGAGDCAAWIIAFIAALFTFGVGLILVLLWAFTKFRRLRMGATSLNTGSTRLVVSGYPRQVVAEAEQWIRANLPVEDASG
jgi:hypothetical protein